MNIGAPEGHAPAREVVISQFATDESRIVQTTKSFDRDCDRLVSEVYKVNQQLLRSMRRSWTNEKRR